MACFFRGSDKSPQKALDEDVFIAKIKFYKIPMCLLIWYHQNVCISVVSLNKDVVVFALMSPKCEMLSSPNLLTFLLITPR